ncbi:EH domain-containing protein 1 [Sarotherodon galilaeus]
MQEEKQEECIKFSLSVYESLSEDVSLIWWFTLCVASQASSVTIKKEVEYTPVQVTQPFVLLGMDLIGPLKMTSIGNQYICVFIDNLRKWPQAYQLKSKSADEVTQYILKFFFQFEAPKRILTDQGKEFVNELNRNICKILNIQRSRCAPYHPQTNGLVERMNGTIQRGMGQHLDAVMFGLRTKYSPFFLMFGREARYPTQIPDEYRVDSSVEDILSVEEATEGILKLDEVLQTALSNSRPIPNFQVDMKVWRLNMRSQQRKVDKLDPNYPWPLYDYFHLFLCYQSSPAFIQNVFIVNTYTLNYLNIINVIIPGEKRSVFLDPLGERKKNIKHSVCFDFTSASVSPPFGSAISCLPSHSHDNISFRFFMRHRGLNPSRWAFNTLPHPKQQDATSCGAYVLKFAECILDDVPVKFNNSASSIATLRQEIGFLRIHLLLPFTYLYNHFNVMLVFLSVIQIGCDICPQWYHRNCDKKPRMSKKETTFVC